MKALQERRVVRSQSSGCEATQTKQSQSVIINHELEVPAEPREPREHRRLTEGTDLTGAAPRGGSE